MTAEKLGPNGSEELFHLILANFACEGWDPRNGPYPKAPGDLEATDVICSQVEYLNVAGFSYASKPSLRLER